MGASRSFVEKDYVRKTAETLEAQAARRKRAAEQNAQREDIDAAMGEGGGDEEEDGESEDDNEDGQGSGVAVNLGMLKQECKTRWSSTHNYGLSLMKTQENIQ